jgi:glycine reductase complex component B subunit alpha and beta
MQLTLARHPVTEIHFATQTRLDGTVLVMDPEELRRVVLEDETIESVNFEIVRPGESCRAGPIFDIVEPRVKEPGSSPDFPGILGPPTSAGMGITHVLDGAAISVLAERSPGESRSVTGRVLEMSGPSAEATVYSSLQHLVVVPHTRAGLPIHTIDKGPTARQA